MADVNAVRLETIKRTFSAAIIVGVDASGGSRTKEHSFKVNPNIEIDEDALTLAHSAMVKFMDLAEDGGTHIYDNVRSKLEESVGD